jgi:hypothetical protein
MLNKGLTQAQGNETPPYTFSDEETKKKIKRHLTDITDVITEKDIKNAKIPGAEEKSDLFVTPVKKAKKKKNPTVDDIPGNPATPWDVLSE